MFVSLLVLLTFYMGWADVMEYKLYDMRAKLRARAKAGDAVVMTGIDDQSIREIGRWPWPRNYLAEMTDQLAEAGAKVIGIDVFLREPELNPGLQQIKTMQAAFSEKLDSIALATNVVLPMYFELGVAIGTVDKPVPDFVAKSFIANTVEVHRGLAPGMDVVGQEGLRQGCCCADIGNSETLNLRYDFPQWILAALRMNVARPR